MRSPQQHSKAKTWSETSLLVFFDNSPTPLIADAMHGQNVISFLKPILPNSSIVGPAVTVKTNPNDWGTVVAAVDVASNGDVLFIDGSGSNFAVWGGLASRAAQQRGVAGTVVNASCRDVTTIEMLQYPVWARGITPRAGLPLNKGAVNVSLIVDGVTVRPRDLVKADAHGVVIIPSGEVAAVADRVLEIVQKEHAMEKGLKKGRRWSELLEDFSS
ncbi:MAG TPA: RraA family protein [Candidatus Bathyarchaeia archaeon]|nr:RraA family protein [Candidatus Bathyarchaeia archaeon]